MMRRLLALSLLSFAVPALAGVRMEFKDTQAGDPAPRVAKALAGTDRLRIETEGNAVIFRGDKQVLWVLDAQQSSYMEMTKDGPAGMADAMKEMQAALADMPPEQRAMMESMMKERMGGAMPGAPKAAPKTPLTWTPNGKSDTVAGHACKGYDGMRDGKLEETICAADPTTFGLTRDDFKAFEAFGEFMKQVMSSMPQMAQQMEIQAMGADMPGIPLRTVIKTPQGDSIHELTLIEKADAPGNMFDVPAGYTKQEMGDMDDAPRGRRGRG